ncbi:hypothetical protein, partial [Salmonella sp. s54925]|uniref:hypothetical protein n=1 Tax=Salmonella sp. s54925 TaxID=3159674 RepID=UPI00397F3E0A
PDQSAIYTQTKTEQSYLRKKQLYHVYKKFKCKMYLLSRMTWTVDRVIKRGNDNEPTPGI